MPTVNNGIGKLVVFLTEIERKEASAILGSSQKARQVIGKRKRTKVRERPDLSSYYESLILAQDERWRRA